MLGCNAIDSPVMILQAKAVIQPFRTISQTKSGIKKELSFTHLVGCAQLYPSHFESPT